MLVKHTFTVLKPTEIGLQVAPAGSALTLEWPDDNPKAIADIKELLVGGYIRPGEDDED